MHLKNLVMLLHGDNMPATCVCSR